MKGFRPYVDYVMIKRHFEDSPFVWRENAEYGRLKPSTFQKRKDCAFFVRLENENSGDRKKWVDRLVSGFVFDRNLWIGDVFEQDHIDSHHCRMRRFGALESAFSRECEEIEYDLVSEESCLKNVLLTSGTGDPIIMGRFMKPTSLETFSVLEHFTAFTRSWFPINPIQKMRRNLIYKYSLLLRLEERDLSRMEKTYHQLSVNLAPSAPTRFKEKLICHSQI